MYCIMNVFREMYHPLCVSQSGAFQNVPEVILCEQQKCDRE